jgi:hypothetical protein
MEDMNKITLQDKNNEVFLISMAEYQTSFNVLHDRVVLKGEILARRMLPLFVWKLLMQSHKEDSYLRLVNICTSKFIDRNRFDWPFRINLTDETLF